MMPDDLPAYLFDSSLDVPDVRVDDVLDIDWVGVLRRMIEIRETEDLLGRKAEELKFRTPVHLSIGQEAVPAGVALSLRSTDMAYGNHRSHGHYLAMGGSRYRLLCEVLGKSAGCSRGMGGSMHITAPEVGFVGSVPIVAGTIPMAVGAALFLKRNRTGAIAVAFFGDGAVEEGVFHESINFAAIQRLPILFVIENNIFSSHMHISERQPEWSVARFARANGVGVSSVDGNDPASVFRAARTLVDRVRDGRGPACLEAVTYRWRAHVGPPDDLEVGLNRQEDLPNWMRRDPIGRLAAALQTTGLVEAGFVDAESARLREELANEWARAESEANPALSQLHQFVLSETAT